MPRNDSNSLHLPCGKSCQLKLQSLWRALLHASRGVQHSWGPSACIQDRLDANTNTTRTHTLTNADIDKHFVFIWFSLKLGKYLPEWKRCLRSSSRSPLASDDRQTWSVFKQPTRPMIRALLHSVGKPNYTGSPLQNNADWNCHLSVTTSCQEEKGLIQLQFEKKKNLHLNYVCRLKLLPSDWHQQEDIKILIQLDIDEADFC